MFMRHATEEATQSLSLIPLHLMTYASLQSWRHFPINGEIYYHIYSCIKICNLLHLHIIKKAANQTVFGLERKECAFIF